MPAAAIILAAGLGTRMRSALPKALHPIAGRPMLVIWSAPASRSSTASWWWSGPACRRWSGRSAPHATVVQRGAARHRRMPRCMAAPLLAARRRRGGALCRQPADPGRTRSPAAGAPAAPEMPALALLAMRPGRSRPLRPGDRAATAMSSASSNGRMPREAERAIGLCNAGVLCAAGRRHVALAGRGRQRQCQGRVLPDRHRRRWPAPRAGASPPWRRPSRRAGRGQLAAPNSPRPRR